MKRVMTFGEVMLRLTPTGDERLARVSEFTAHFGGSEYNVAAGLVSLGIPARCVTRLPDNPLGHRALAAMRESGVEITDDILAPQGRLGIYFLEPGYSPRPNRAVYDRAGSTLSLTPAKDFDWETYLGDASWFHVSGITPALGDSLQKATIDAVKQARERDLPVSIDINYRAKLWSTDAAGKTLEPLLRQARVVISTEEDLERMFGIIGESPRELAEKARERFDARVVAITLRELETVRRNRWGGCALGPDGFMESRMYEVEVVDRVGAGDAFTAGLIAGILEDNLAHAVNLAAAFSALKQTIPGDICTATRDETRALIASGGAGRIQR